jgi:hypothetical protein
MLALLESAGDRFGRGVSRSPPLSALGLEQLALERSALAGLKRSDPRKIAIARVIRARIAVPTSGSRENSRWAT